MPGLMNREYYKKDFLISEQEIQKNNIRTSLPNKAHRALSANEVRILFFDDAAEEKKSRCP